ncbi:hypothetical protein GUJ93_ZPchr0002g25988 [Zizania palustris]|uniref:Uncharacterized protein n=1 Tax=Zizania palustris TaxID=103762 RepID=A0A8J5RY59_ZIZPA|nr:hypothetical protein GUJ93_ZPchr0002g25988 [Zizania palustris]
MTSMEEGPGCGGMELADVAGLMRDASWGLLPIQPITCFLLRALSTLLPTWRIVVDEDNNSANEEKKVKHHE